MNKPCRRLLTRVVRSFPVFALGRQPIDLAVATPCDAWYDKGIGGREPATNFVNPESNIVQELIVRFGRVLHEETMAMDVVQHIAFDQHALRPVNRHTAVIGIGDAGVAQDVAGAISSDMPMDGIPALRRRLACPDDDPG